MDAVNQIEKFKEFFEANHERDIAEIVQKGMRSIVVDFVELSVFDVELAEELLEDPEEVIKAAELALTQFDVIEKSSLERVRFRNLPDSQQIRISDIRSRNLCELLEIEGIVRQASDVRPQVTSAKFECGGCGNTISILQIDAKFKEPTRCTCGVRGRFRLLSKELVDAQHLKIEEAPESLDGGEQPKRLSVFLKEDLVEPKMEKKCSPGSKVKITGIVKEVPVILKTGAKSIRFDLILEANFIESAVEDYSTIEISNEEVEEIKAFARKPNVFEKFSKSIAPSIYGHDKIKNALVLQMFGGNRRVKPDGTTRRGDIHVLLCGDPGSGKSQLISFVAKAAPKARYVSGHGASGAGLTAAVVKDEFLKGWALEAGTMALAHKGIAVVDELDKMSHEDRSALHSALEQQIITIAKANIQACYSEDTEVLTECGWRKYFEVADLKIATFDLRSNSIKFMKHKGLFVYDYDGFLYFFKNRGVDVFVTPDHKMLYKEQSHKKYSVSKAEEINCAYFYFLNSGKYENNKEMKYFVLPSVKYKQNKKYVHQRKVKKIPMNLWLEFLGYFLTEGDFETGFTISISQKHGNRFKKIKICLKKLSDLLNYSLTEVRGEKCTWLKITSLQLFDFLKKNCGENQFKKNYSLNFSYFSKIQLKILYDAMMLGSGLSSGKSYSSINLSDMLQAITCLIGKSASIHVQHDKSSHVRRQTCKVVVSDVIDTLISKSSIFKVKYKGKVFCFSTGTGFFVTRRNGKISIQGNTLNSQTTLLAAANPKLGRFDPYTPIAGQINLPPSLLNRFDLIFPVRDLPDKEKDTKIASHVLETMVDDTLFDTEVSVEFLKKYVSYAKQKINPKLTKGAINEIKDFYVKLRNSGSTSEDKGIKPIPISARQLEGLMRLAEASAKVRLDEKVRREDAIRSIELLRSCLMDVGFDPETGQIDIDRISSGITASARSKIIAVKEIVNELESKGLKMIPIEEIIAAAAMKGIEESKVEEAIEKLKRSGDLFEPKKGHISRI